VKPICASSNRLSHLELPARGRAAAPAPGDVEGPDLDQEHRVRIDELELGDHALDRRFA
jgi:hypothetical protein